MNLIQNNFIYHYSIIFAFFETFTDDISSVWDKTKTIPEVGTLLNQYQYKIYKSMYFNTTYDLIYNKRRNSYNTG